VTLLVMASVYDEPIAKVVVPEAIFFDGRPARGRMHRIDLRHHGATPQRKPLDRISCRAEHCGGRALAFAGVRNTPRPLPSRNPLFRAQGTTDDIVRPK